MGIVGTGVIGAGWTVRCLARGLNVVAWDPGANAEAKLRSAVDTAWPALAKLGTFPNAKKSMPSLGHFRTPRNQISVL
jgi:carnitine 3-dehydrogenase